MIEYENKPLNMNLLKSTSEAVMAFKLAQTAHDIADVLEIPYGQLKHILYDSPEEKRYNVFSIPKKTGGERTISAPNNSISILQNKLKPILEGIINIRADVHGLAKGRSIVSNAGKHIKKRFVLNFDLKDFYPTINFGRVRGVLMALPLNLGEGAATVVAQLLCYRGSLPQGACTSPIIACHVARNLDGKLSELARRANCVYSRYADDITISTRMARLSSLIATYDEEYPVQGEVILSREVLSAVKASGFEINPTKTRLQTKLCRQSVTGLTVNEFPNVERSFINKTRCMIYSWKKYGLISASNYSTGLLEFSKELEGEGLCNYFKSVVYGRLAYISMVRGRDAVLLNLVKPIPELDSKCPEYIKQICDMNEEYDVFIGHASEDKVIARELTASLKGLGLKVFLDENELKWGDSLTEKINFSLSKSKTFLAMMSEDSIKKKWPKKEVNAALNREIQGRQIFLPLIIGDTNKILEKYPLIEEKFYQKWEDNAQDLADLINELLSNNNDLGEQN